MTQKKTIALGRVVRRPAVLVSLSLRRKDVNHVQMFPQPRLQAGCVSMSSSPRSCSRIRSGSASLVMLCFMSVYLQLVYFAIRYGNIPCQKVSLRFMIVDCLHFKEFR